MLRPHRGSSHRVRARAAGRTIFNYSGSAVSIPDGNQPSILNTSYTITADIVSFECGYDAFIHYGRSVDDFVAYAARHDCIICDLYGATITDAAALSEAMPVMWDFYFVPIEKSARFTATISRVA